MIQIRSIFRSSCEFFGYDYCMFIFSIFVFFLAVIHTHTMCNTRQLASLYREIFYSLLFINLIIFPLHICVYSSLQLILFFVPTSILPLSAYSFILTAPTYSLEVTTVADTHMHTFFVLFLDHF